MDPETCRETSGAALAPGEPAACPFHDGPRTLDLLLAELCREPVDLLDLALELRSEMAARADAERCLRLLFELRARLDGRRHLALYRVRRWLRRSIRVELRSGPSAAWQVRPLPAGCARLDELVNSCLASLALDSEDWPFLAQVRFVFVAVPQDARAGGL